MRSFSITPILAILLLYQGVLACQCTDPFRTPYEDFENSAVVFVGTVSGFRDRIIDAPNELVERRFQFNVEETLKGQRLKKREVITGITRDICYAGFGDPSSRYLVYANLTNGKMQTSLFCSRRSMAADLHFLRRKLRKVNEPRIYGVIEREKLGKLVLRVQIVDEATNTRVFTKIDELGFFAVDELPDGTYLVKIQTSDGRSVSLDEEYRVRLGDPNRSDDLGSPKKSAFLKFPIR